MCRAETREFEAQRAHWFQTENGPHGDMWVASRHRLSFPRKREPNSAVFPEGTAIWVPASAGMTGCVYFKLTEFVTKNIYALCNATPASVPCALCGSTPPRQRDRSSEITAGTDRSCRSHRRRSRCRLRWSCPQCCPGNLSAAERASSRRCRPRNYRPCRSTPSPRRRL